MSMASPLDNDFVRETVKSQEDIIIATLRAQIKEIEDAKAAEHMKRVKTEEAESLRKQLRSYGVTPAA
jgi:hypothetical protein